MPPTPDLPELPPPRRSDAELTQVVRGRVTDLRARRRARRRAGVVGACAAVAVLVIASVALASNHHSARVDTADSSGTSVESTTTVADSYTMTVPPSTTPSSTSEPTSTDAPTTTLPETTTTTLPACTWSQFAVVVAAEGGRDLPNKSLPPTFAPGDVVTITMTLHNEGDACYSGDAPPFVLDWCPRARAEDADDHDVWDDTGLCSTVLHFGPVPSDYSSTVSVTWDQDRCPESDWPLGGQGCPQAPRVSPGTYTITVADGGSAPPVTDTTIDLLAYVDPPITTAN